MYFPPSGDYSIPLTRVVRGDTPTPNESVNVREETEIAITCLAASGVEKRPIEEGGPKEEAKQARCLEEGSELAAQAKKVDIHAKKAAAHARRMATVDASTRPAVTSSFFAVPTLGFCPLINQGSDCWFITLSHLILNTPSLKEALDFVLAQIPEDPHAKVLRQFADLYLIRSALTTPISGESVNQARQAWQQLFNGARGVTRGHEDVCEAFSLFMTRYEAVARSVGTPLGTLYFPLNHTRAWAATDSPLTPSTELQRREYSSIQLNTENRSLGSTTRTDHENHLKLEVRDEEPLGQSLQGLLNRTLLPTEVEDGPKARFLVNEETQLQEFRLEREQVVLPEPPEALHVVLTRFGGGDGDHHKVTSELIINPVIQIPATHENVLYELVGAILHAGSLEAGHYISVHRNQQGLFVICNDDTVQWLSPQDMQVFLLGTADFSPYILQYRRMAPAEVAGGLEHIAYFDTSVQQLIKARRAEEEIQARQMALFQSRMGGAVDQTLPRWLQATSQAAREYQSALAQLTALKEKNMVYLRSRHPQFFSEVEKILMLTVGNHEPLPDSQVATILEGIHTPWVANSGSNVIEQFIHRANIVVELKRAELWKKRLEAMQANGRTNVKDLHEAFPAEEERTELDGLEIVFSVGESEMSQAALEESIGLWENRARDCKKRYAEVRRETMELLLQQVSIPIEVAALIEELGRRSLALPSLEQYFHTASQWTAGANGVIVFFINPFLASTPQDRPSRLFTEATLAHLVKLEENLQEISEFTEKLKGVVSLETFNAWKTEFASDLNQYLDPIFDCLHDELTEEESAFFEALKSETRPWIYAGGGNFFEQLIRKSEHALKNRELALVAVVLSLAPQQTDPHSFLAKYHPLLERHLPDLLPAMQDALSRKEKQEWDSFVLAAEKMFIKNSVAHCESLLESYFRLQKILGDQAVVVDFFFYLDLPEALRAYCLRQIGRKGQEAFEDNPTLISDVLLRTFPKLLQPVEQETRVSLKNTQELFAAMLAYASGLGDESMQDAMAHSRAPSNRSSSNESVRSTNRSPEDHEVASLLGDVHPSLEFLPAMDVQEEAAGGEGPVFNNVNEIFN